MASPAAGAGARSAPAGSARRGLLPPALFLLALPLMGLLALLPQGLPRWPGGLAASLGMVMALLGVAVASGAWLALLVPPLFGVFLHRRFVLPEQAHMRATFGAAYADYCRRVRCWL